MKIFKYTVRQSNGRHYILAPKNIKIIRMGHVDDGFYKGDFVWGIVHPEDSQVLQYIDYVETSNCIPRSFRTQLAVKEKQTLKISGKPIAASDIDGKLYLFHTIEDKQQAYDIVFYKTGQPINEPLEDLQYLGLCRLWIMQELGLYTFLIRNKNESF